MDHSTESVPEITEEEWLAYVADQAELPGWEPTDAELETMAAYFLDSTDDYWPELAA